MEAEEKIVGIMQPYFFPYFEQFRLIAACDIWVVFDTAQFSRKSWMTRNRIQNRDKGTSYISVPVKHSGLDTLIKDALIDTKQNWHDKIMNKLGVYRTEAPNFSAVCDLVSASISGPHENIAALNTEILRTVCCYLEISTPILRASTMTLDIPARCEPGEWALHISKSLAATEYRNAAGGRALFDSELYARNGITLGFHEHRPRRYRTGSFDFVDDLSVIDWMMWNDREILHDWLA